MTKIRDLGAIDLCKTMAPKSHATVPLTCRYTFVLFVTHLTICTKVVVEYLKEREGVPRVRGLLRQHTGQDKDDILFFQTKYKHV